MTIRELIERGHTIGEYARDASGLTVAPENHTAVCWCLAGARLAAYANNGPALVASRSAMYEFVLNYLAGQEELINVTRFNDNPDIPFSVKLACADAGDEAARKTLD